MVRMAESPFTKDPATLAVFGISAISSIVMALAVASMNGLRPFRLKRSNVRNIMSASERWLGVLYALALLALEGCGIQAGYWLEMEWLLPSHKWVLAYMSVKLLCCACYFVALWARTSFRHFLLMPFGIFTGFFIGLVLTEILEDAFDVSTAVFGVFAVFSLLAYAVPPTAIMVDKISAEMSREQNNTYVLDSTPVGVQVQYQDADGFGQSSSSVVEMREVHTHGDAYNTDPPHERYPASWDK